MKLSAKRADINFEYEFNSGDVAEFTYTAPSTQQMEDALEVSKQEDAKSMLEFSKKVLKENLSGDKKLIKKMIEELETYGDIYDFKETLDIAVGKLKKKRKNG